MISSSSDLHRKPDWRSKVPCITAEIGHESALGGAILNLFSIGIQELGRFNSWAAYRQEQRA
jgi:hypothetical protein